MSILHRGNQRQLNGKDCFLAWYETGSIVRAAKKFETLGIKNLKSGKPYTENGIYFAALTWVCEHPEESRPYYIKAGSIIAEDDNMWEEWLVKTYMGRYRKSRNRFVKWARVHGFYQKYFHLFSDFYGIVDINEFEQALED